MRSLQTKRLNKWCKGMKLWGPGSLALVLVAMQGCVSSGVYYLPSAEVPSGVNKQVRKAPCALPVGGPYAIFMEYPGLTISASATGYIIETDVTGSLKKNTELSVRFSVSENHSAVTSLSNIELNGMSGTRYYWVDVPAGKVAGDREVPGGSGGTYTVIIEDTQVTPSKFQVVVPSLLLDGREIGPVAITFTRHVGIWTEPLSC